MFLQSAGGNDEAVTTARPLAADIPPGCDHSGSRRSVVGNISVRTISLA